MTTRKESLSRSIQAPGLAIEQPCPVCGSTNVAVIASQAEPLMDVKGVAHFFGMTSKWVYARVAEGVLPCVRMGGLSAKRPRLRFRPHVVRAWVEPASVKP